VDTRDALHETGDLIQPIEAGVIGPERILGSLAELTRGTVAGRSSEDQITLFKAVGSSLADLVAARLVYRSL
jgi:ornithine cyclodeaminase